MTIWLQVGTAKRLPQFQEVTDSRTAAGLLVEINRLRARAWATDLPTAAAEDWLDDRDVGAQHWVTMDGDVVVAAARLTIHREIDECADREAFGELLTSRVPVPIASMNRLVVQPSHRGRGLASQLDHVRLEAAARAGCRTVLATTIARRRTEALLRRGFTMLGVGPPLAGRLQSLGPCDLLAAAVPGRRGTTPELTENAHGWSSRILSECAEACLRFQVTQSGWAIDVGAAFGVASMPLAVLGARVVATDIDERHLRTMKAGVSPETGRLRSHGVLARVPRDDCFAAGCATAVHCSNVLHFLSGEEIGTAVRQMARWLRPGGRLFLMTATPFVGHLAGHLEEYERRARLGIRWPGEISEARRFAVAAIAPAIPSFLHLLEPDYVVPVIDEAGLRVLESRVMRRRGLPRVCRYDGRENLMIVAEKPSYGTRRSRTARASTRPR